MNELLQIMARLRDPASGCPWDTQQTFESIAPYTIEEAYEVADAIERQNLTDLKEELGDLLLQVVFHSQMASEQGAFDFADVVKTISAKMIRRHPHVFGDETAGAAEDVSTIWEREKSKERAQKGSQNHSLLADVPPGLPGLARAVKLQKKAARVGFDWPCPRDVWTKLEEELDELQAEVAKPDPTKDAIADELGDVLFVIANLARKLDVDPDAALRRTNEKFKRRFQFIENKLEDAGRSVNEATLDEMEELWLKAKSEAAS